MAKHYVVIGEDEVGTPDFRYDILYVGDDGFTAQGLVYEKHERKIMQVWVTGQLLQEYECEGNSGAWSLTHDREAQLLERRTELMDELKKINRVISALDAERHVSKEEE